MLREQRRLFFLFFLTVERFLVLWKSPVTLIKFELSWLTVELVGGLFLPNPTVWQPNFVFVRFLPIVMIGVSEMRPIDTLLWWDETDDCLSAFCLAVCLIKILTNVLVRWKMWMDCLRVRGAATATFCEYGTRLCPMFF